MEKPPYAPNVVNQTVDWKGWSFRGDPGRGWHTWWKQGTKGGEIPGMTGEITIQTSPLLMARQLYEQQQKFKRPAIQTLEKGRAKIAPMFAEQRRAIEAERDPLEQRYQSLLKDITHQTELATSKEFGKRGIPLSSGVYEEALGKRLGPQIEKIGLEREAGLRGLTNLAGQLTGQEAQMGLDLNSAIAAIQAATGEGAVDAALRLYGAQQQAKQEAARLALERWQTEQGAKLREAQTKYYESKATPETGTDYLTLAEGSTLYDPTTGKVIYKAPKTYKPSDVFGDEWEGWG